MRQAEDHVRERRISSTVSTITTIKAIGRITSRVTEDSCRIGFEPRINIDLATAVNPYL